MDFLHKCNFFLGENGFAFRKVLVKSGHTFVGLVMALALTTGMPVVSFNGGRREESKIN